MRAWLWTIFVLFPFSVASEPLPGAAGVTCNGNAVCYIIPSALTEAPGENVGTGFEVKGWTLMDFIRRCQLVQKTYGVPMTTKQTWGNGPVVIKCVIQGTDDAVMWMQDGK